MKRYKFFIDFDKEEKWLHEMAKSGYELVSTPGLWEKAGSDFWLSFLFETPFALMRGFLWLIFPVNIMLFLYYAIRASILQKKQFRPK